MKQRWSYWLENWVNFSKICQKKIHRNRLFYWLFLGEVSPWNFLWNRPIFLRIYPWESFEIWIFSAKIPRNWPIFPQICPWKSREILIFFFREISEALMSPSPETNESHHPVKKRKKQVRNWKCLGLFVTHTVNMKTDSKTLFYSVVQLKCSPIL